ncbi:MAG: DinB family protein [Thermoanaerobaculia bacterium]
MRPDPSEFAPYYGKYIDLVPESDILAALQQQSSETQKLLASLDEERASYRYEPGKWSVKELFGHVIDAERIFGYRAVAIARGETKSLPGYDENVYAENGRFDLWRIGDLSESYALIRRSNVVAFSHFPDEAWGRPGVANGNPVTARAIAFTMLGHERHHLNVLRERYRIG